MIAPIGIDAQTVVNNGLIAGGSCNGGNPGGVYRHAHKNGLVHNSCEQYVASNLFTKFTGIDECRDCSWPPPAEGESGLENCKSVTATKYYIKDHYSVRGADKMKAAL